MKLSKVCESSNVQELEYDVEKKRLVVTFKGGARYQYDDVTRATYDELAAAPSVGKHLAAYIKNEHPVTRLGAE